MRLALYDPVVGYYRRDHQRVGRTADADFYTSTSSGPIFGELIAAAARHLLGTADPHAYTFVEIGAEPAGGVLRDVAHPFAEARTVPIGETPRLAGNCVVFSNELFDAQPFRRFRRAKAIWEESYVTADKKGLLREDYQPTELPFDAPDTTPAGYCIDWSEAASALARDLTAEPWHGVFIAVDYGKSWAELTTATPAGTARAYLRHTQSNDLLASPGRQDLTAHVCWDDLQKAVAATGFSVDSVRSQEAFLVKNAGDYLAQVLAQEGGRFSARKQSIMQLLHPVNLGQKFQVLTAHRHAAEISP